MKKFFFMICAILVIIPVAYGRLFATKFPGTISDFSFKSRVENLTDGYKPFFDKKTYQELNIVPGEEIFTDHMIAVNEADAEQQKTDVQTMNISEYCAKYPNDEKCKQPSEPKTNSTPLNQPPQSISIGSVYEYTIGGGPVIENNFVTGASCYPADHDRNFPDKILTTGKFEKQYPALEKGLITIFRKEGKCGAIKNDPCGYTCYGIGSNPKCTGIVVHSRNEAENIYHDIYWKKYKIDKLPDVISTDVFLAGIASGPGTALSQFRRFLGLPNKTSAVDNEMIAAVNNYKGDIHNDWLDVRDKFLQDIARRRYNNSVSNGYKNAIELKRKNGCHTRPQTPLYRQ